MVFSLIVLHLPPSPTPYDPTCYLHNNQQAKPRSYYSQLCITNTTVPPFGQWFFCSSCRGEMPSLSSYNISARNKQATILFQIWSRKMDLRKNDTWTKKERREMLTYERKKIMVMCSINRVVAPVPPKSQHRRL